MAFEGWGYGVVIVAFLITACLHEQVATPVCGFWTPGRSPLWSAQAGSTFASDGVVWWPTFPSGPTLQMSTFEDAITYIDANHTTVPVTSRAITHERLKLHANLVPHVYRRWLTPSKMNASAIVHHGHVLHGKTKPLRGNYISHRSVWDSTLAVKLTLDEFLHSEHKYWSRCYDSSGSDPKVSGWVDWVLEHVSPDIIPGIRTRLSVCLRVALEQSRMPFHFDAKHNILIQIHGIRKVLLMMPDTGPTVYPTAISRGHEPPGWVSTLDPRHLNYTEHPYAEKARMLVVTLFPGDALYIPAAWWHYVENTPSVDGYNNNFSIALNIFAQAQQSKSLSKEFHAQPCDPDSWAVRETLTYMLSKFQHRFFS